MINQEHMMGKMWTRRLIKFSMAHLGMDVNEAAWYVKKYRIFAHLNYWRYCVSEEERKVERLRELN